VKSSAEAPEADNQSSPLAAEAPWKLYQPRQRWGLLAILFLVSTSNYLDRNVVSVLLEPIKQEFRISDTLLGLLGGLAFALFYATLGLPVARWADRGNRRTAIAVALSAWSIATACCGFAQSFLQLLLARVGVGVGEAGAISPAQSLLVDYFPPERRATAMGVFISGANAGLFLGISGGSYLATVYGWRVAFIACGLPGLLLAVVVRLFISEPRERLGFPVAPSDAANMSETLRTLWRKTSYRNAVAGICVYFFVAYGALIFMPSFYVRVLHVGLTEMGSAYGAVSAAAALIGTLGGGYLADRLARRDPRWLAWLPAIACAMSGPIYILALASNTFGTALGISFWCGLLLAGGLPPVFAAIHEVCGSTRRATAIAVVFFAASLFGNGLGPVVAGAMSDALSERFGVNGLRYTMQILMLLLLVAGAAFYRFGRALPAEREP
jgi:MFS family permease